MTVYKRLLAVAGWKGRGLDFGVGMVAVLGHAPFHIWIVTLVCFGFLMARLDTAREVGHGGFSRAMWFGLGYFLAGTFWIGSAFIVRGPEFIPAMPPMILGLAATLAVFWGLAGYVYVRFFGSRPLRWIGLVALLWIAEFARGHMFGGLPWNLPAYIFKAGGFWSFTAAYIGAYGLSFVAFAMSVIFATLLKGEQRGLGGALSAVCLCGLMVAGVKGQFGKQTSGQVPHHENVNIRVVHVPFSQKDKFDRELSIGIVNEFIRTSLEPGIEDITHLVWPEGAVIGLAIDNRPLLDAMGQVLTQGDSSPPFWILNSLRVETRPPAPGRTPKDYYYNTSALIAFDPDGTPALKAMNDKYRLVPFGEFIPGGEFMERLGSKTLSTSLASITAARSKELADFPGLPKLSPQLCYEIIFPGLTPRPKDRPRAQWILNQSNDAWYGRSTGPAQHANIAAYRAIEEGVPIVRSASNGVSGLIDPYGRYVKKLEAEEKGVIDIQLPTPRNNIIYGAWMNWALLLINLVLLLITALLSRRKGAPQ